MRQIRLIWGLGLVLSLVAGLAYGETTASSSNLATASITAQLEISTIPNVAMGALSIAGVNEATHDVTVKSNAYYDIKVAAIGNALMKEWCPGTPTCTNACVNAANDAGYKATGGLSLQVPLKFYDYGALSFVNISTTAALLRNDAAATPDNGTVTTLKIKQPIGYGDRTLNDPNDTISSVGHMYRIDLQYTFGQGL